MTERLLSDGMQKSVRNFGAQKARLVQCKVSQYHGFYPENEPCPVCGPVVHSAPPKTTRLKSAGEKYAAKYCPQHPWSSMNTSEVEGFQILGLSAGFTDDVAPQPPVDDDVLDGDDYSGLGGLWP